MQRSLETRISRKGKIAQSATFRLYITRNDRSEFMLENYFSFTFFFLFPFFFKACGMAMYGGGRRLFRFV
jgi:hypothetical protein